jgi:hypothetical protein
MVFDSKRGVTVMYGGVGGDQHTRYEDTWELVNHGPQFTVMPSDQLVSSCTPASFTAMAVAADGPVTYQWFKDGQPLSESERLSGVTSTNLMITQVQMADQGYYWAQVSSDCGTNSTAGTNVIAGLSTNVFPGAKLTVSNSWVQVARTGPAPRAQHAMSYDAARGVTVMFGGLLRNFSFSSETWEWNGNSWIFRSNQGPQARYGATMAYDSDHGTNYLFGGNVGNLSVQTDMRNDLWAWDGLSWKAIDWKSVSANGPAPRVYSSSCYDSDAHKFVIYGGENASDSDTDTWEYDPGSGRWTKVADGTPYEPIWGSGMAYDTARHVRVLTTRQPSAYSGRDIIVSEWMNGKWQQNTNAQTDPVPASFGLSFGRPPQGLGGYGFTYNPDRKLVILNSGTSDGNIYPWTWGYDGNWHILYNKQGPAVADGAVVYDTQRSTLVQFGGSRTNGVTANTWELADADQVQILKSPIGGNGASNQVVRLSATVRGKEPMTYRWQKDGSDLSDNAVFSGSATGTLTLTNPTADVANGVYTVTVQNDCSTATSGPVPLSVVPGALSLGLTAISAGSTISWATGNVVLESAPAISGPWTAVMGAVSPFNIVLDQAQFFFRLRQQ